MTTPAVPLVERLELPARDLDRGVLLRAFDTLRRRLALRSTGTEGAAVGFVDLDLSDVSDASDGQVVVRATVLETGASWQRIRYEAVLQADPELVDGVDGSATERSFGHAIGQTVALGSPTAPDRTVPLAS